GGQDSWSALASACRLATANARGRASITGCGPTQLGELRLGLATDTVLLLLKIRPQRLTVTGELLLELFEGFGIAFFRGDGHLAFQKNLALGDFCHALRFEIGDLLLLFIGQLGAGRG